MYNELFHYGMPKRSGRYPYGSGDRPYQRSGGISGYIKRKKAAKQEKAALKKREEQMKKAKEAAEAQRKHIADKERVLREGTASEVLQYKNELTNQELSNALNRIRWMNDLERIAKSEVDDGFDKIDAVMKKVGKINDWTSIGLNSYKNVDQILKIIENLDNKSSSKK